MVTLKWRYVPDAKYWTVKNQDGTGLYLWRHVERTGIDLACHRRDLVNTLARHQRMGLKEKA